MKIRLDKYLAESQNIPRSQAKKQLKAKQIKVNGLLATKGDQKIALDTDVVLNNDHQLTYQAHSYFLMNKPQGVISATKDPRHRTVLDLLAPEDRKTGLFPVGRLDKDTEGLLILTTNGAWAHEVLAPKHHVAKRYYLEVDGLLKPDHIQQLAGPVKLNAEETVSGGKLELIDGQSAYLTITEGKFHQVKRMVHTLGMSVTYLKRVGFGNLKLPESLALGGYIEISEKSISAIKTL